MRRQNWCDFPPLSVSVNRFLLIRPYGPLDDVMSLVGILQCCSSSDEKSRFFFHRCIVSIRFDTGNQSIA